MEKTDENNLADEWLKELAATNDLPTFKPDEMLVCEKCGRKTPPTRANCFYCGALLPVSELQTEYFKLNTRKLESWEKGFNIIFVKQNENFNSVNLTEAATFLSFENEELQKILTTGRAFPLVRVESENEAAIIIEKLAKNNIESRIINDKQLKSETATRRLRGIEFFDDRAVLILFNADETFQLKYEDLALIVVGTIYERKIESVESVKRKERGKVLDSSETGTDEILIDLYPHNDEIGYRIESSGFDFFCLEQEKGILARENMKRLAKKLKSLFLNAAYDDDYQKIRAALGKVWEVEEKSSAGELGRKSFGSFRRTNTLTISNLWQFTCYSRMQKQVL
jgi:hypothetical protein